MPKLSYTPTPRKVLQFTPTMKKTLDLTAKQPSLPKEKATTSFKKAPFTA